MNDTTTTTISKHDKDGIVEQVKSMFIDGLIKMFLDFSTTTRGLFLSQSLLVFFFFFFNFPSDIF